MALTPTATFSLNSQVSGATLTTPSFTPATGDWIVVKAASESTTSNALPQTPTATGGGISFSLVASHYAGNGCSVGIYVGKVTAGGTAITVSVPFAGGGAPDHDAVVEQWPGSSCTISANPTYQIFNIPPGPLTSVRPPWKGSVSPATFGSAWSWVMSDYYDIDPTGRVYFDTPTEESVDFQAAHLTTYYAYQQLADPRINYSFGIQSYSSTNTGYVTAAGIEILPTVSPNSIPGGMGLEDSRNLFYKKVIGNSSPMSNEDLYNLFLKNKTGKTGLSNEDMEKIYWNTVAGTANLSTQDAKRIAFGSANQYEELYWLRAQP